VDQAPLPSSGTGPVLGLISQGWCLPTPDEKLVHFSLESKPGQDCSENGSIGAKEDPEYHWVACHLIWSRVHPAAGWWLKGPVGWDLNGASKMLGGYFDRLRTKRHLEEWRTQILFYAGGHRYTLCLNPEQRIHRIFKRQCRASSYKNVLRLLGLTVSWRPKSDLET
jgi:hypothetical protein